MDSDRQFWIEFRAGLLKQARELQDLRASLLEQAAAIERKLKEPTKPVTISEGLSIALNKNTGV